MGGAARNRVRRHAAKLTRDEIALWQAAMRGVAPLRDAPAQPLPALSDPVTPDPPAAAPQNHATPQRPPPLRAPALLPITTDRIPGLDKASAGRLKRGKLPIEARLDLHGMTQDEAHRRLDRFIAAATRDGLRCVLVITGKGQRSLADRDADTGGILRAAVPRWLNEAALRPLILAFTHAQQRDGGAGALYILLRRQR